MKQGICHRQIIPDQKLPHLFQILIKPIHHFRHPADPMLRLSGPGQLMVFAVEQADSCLHAEILKRREHLERVAHPAAVVLIRLDKQGRRLRHIRVL